MEIIKKNKWYVDLFAVEVGARGYPSTSLKYSLQKLGFPNNLLKRIIKTLGRISMECSFYIWLHRNSKEWTNYTLSHCNKNDEESPLPKPKVLKSNCKRPVHVNEKQAPSKHVGFVNKGNTCYINSILQSLSVIPSFWNQQPSQFGTISPMLRALSLNLSLLEKRNSPIDPSNFLRTFQNKISEKRGAPFNINTQQDVPEIFQFLLDEIKGVSAIADGLISSAIVRTTTCNNCFSSSSQEDKYDIISLPLTNSLPTSLEMFLKPEELREENRWFCSVCNCLQESVRECNFSNCGSVLIVQLNRYVNTGGCISKDSRKVNCPSEVLNIPVKIDDHLSVSRRFKLKASINHSGTINAGHYWTFIKKTNNGPWLKCNDTVISNARFKELSNNTSYLFIYSSE